MVMIFIPKLESNILNMEEDRERTYSIRLGEIAPFPKRFVEIAKDLMIDLIEISFQGGSDEGYINIDCWGLSGHRDELPGAFMPIAYGRKDRFCPSDNTLMGKAMLKEWNSFEEEIDDWAWKTYGYNGAGEGIDYGDNLVINLVTNKVHWVDWGYTYYENDPVSVQLEIKDGFE